MSIVTSVEERYCSVSQTPNKKLGRPREQTSMESIERYLLCPS